MIHFVSTGAALPSDWSTFYPDLIVAAVTGVVVGLALLIAERVAGGRRERARVKRIANRIVHPLLLAIQRPRFRGNFTRIEQMPKGQAEAWGLIEAAELDEWDELASTDLTRALIRYRSALRDQHHDRADLSQALDEWKYLHGHEPRILEYAHLAIQDVDEHSLRLLFNDKLERERLELEFEVLRLQSKVLNQTRNYRSAVNRTRRAQDEAHGMLVVWMRRSKPPRHGRSVHRTQ